MFEFSVTENCQRDGCKVLPDKSICKALIFILQKHMGSGDAARIASGQSFQSLEECVKLANTYLGHRDALWLLSTTSWPDEV